jgi:hypothetical protein
MAYYSSVGQRTRYTFLFSLTASIREETPSSQGNSVVKRWGEDDD